MTITVDIHCHTFNADDIPVEGFVRNAAKSLPSQVWRALDAIGQGGAPGYREEINALDAELTSGEDGGFMTFERANEEPLVAMEDRAREIAAVVNSTDVAAVPMADAGPELSGLRPPKWARLVAVATSSRLDNTKALLASDEGADLVVPSLVDMEFGTRDWAETTVVQQIEMAEKISRLSMLGRLRAPVHPFVGFDPRREMRSRLVGDIEPALDVVREAVLRYGFIGIKVYPPMGWRPFGNAKQPPKGMDADQGKLCDDVLADLYDWCVEEQVPITAHANPSNYTDPEFKDFSGPAAWQEVYAFDDSRWEKLHINFGHFGGEQRDDGKNGWPQEFSLMADRLPVYADLSNHDLENAGAIREYLLLLRDIFADPARAAMKPRLMVGSDWWMPGGFEPGFISRYIDWYRQVVAEDDNDVDRFSGGAALEFLGFAGADVAGQDASDNRNRLRLVRRYETNGLAVPAWLAADE